MTTTDAGELESVDEGVIPYLQCLEHGSFSPTGWLYSSVMNDLCSRGFVREVSHARFCISAGGLLELEKHRRNEARRLPKILADAERAFAEVE